MPTSRLNQAQREAVEYNDGPLLIVAGAGTGKTTVIAEKIVYLIKEKKIKPNEILAVTFMEKAAHEMEERVAELIPEGTLDIWISTFHGLGQRILEAHGLEFGLSSHFKLLNEIETWLLVRKNLEKFDLDYFRPLGNPTKHIHALCKHFSRCKDELISPNDYLSYAKNLSLDQDLTDAMERAAEELEQKKITELANTYHVYNQILLENNALDFSDLIFYTVKLLQVRPNILRVLQKRWKYILVDEFQDTNWAQYQLIKLLCQGREMEIGLTVVGDDDQSIFKFRGASVSNILEFSNDFPKAKRVVLVDNYRSAQKILDSAYNFIQLNNPDRLEAKLRISKKLIFRGLTNECGTIDFLLAYTASDEAEIIAQKIMALKQNNVDLQWNDCAILARSHGAIEQILPALIKHQIPYQAPAMAGVFRQKIVMGSMAALRLVDNYHESKAVFRLLTSPLYSLSYEDMSVLTHYAEKKTVSLYESLKIALDGVVRLSASGMEKARKFSDDIASLARAAQTEPAIRVLYDFLESSGYLRRLTVNIADNQSEIFALQILFDYLEKFHANNADNSVVAWIKHFDYLMEAGEEGDDKGAVLADGVRVMTVHKAKGLEFAYVFVPNLVDLKFPTVNRRDAIDIPDDLVREKTLPTGDAHVEEERRLLYVALTRAKRGVWLTGAKDYGGTREKKISRFINELQQTNNFVWQTSLPSAPSISAIDRHVAAPSAQQTPPVAIDHFSYSQIAAYRKCPWQYRYQFVLRVPTLGKGSFSFGKTLHLTLQKFYEHMLIANSAAQADLFGNKKPETQVPPLGKLLELFDDNWQDDWFYSAQDKINYKKKGSEILKTYYELSEKNGWAVPLVLEAKFCFKAGHYHFKGQIDRLEMLAGGQAIKIIDYKTGKPKSDLTFDDKLQLLTYQWAANRLADDWQWGKVGELAYYYLENNTETAFLGTEKDLDKTEATITAVMEKIARGDHAPTPDSNTCAHCDFKEICDFRV